MPSKAEELFVVVEEEASPWPDWISSSYDILTVLPESRIITYGGDSGSSVDMEMLSDSFGNGEAARFRIGDTGSGILLMVPRSSASFCWINVRLPGGKGSWMGYVLFWSKPQIKPPSKRKGFGRLVIGSIDSSSQKSGRQ